MLENFNMYNSDMKYEIKRKCLSEFDSENEITIG